MTVMIGVSHHDWLVCGCDDRVCGWPASSPLPLDAFNPIAGFFVVDTPSEAFTVTLNPGEQTEIEYGLTTGAGLVDTDVLRAAVAGSGFTGGSHLGGMRQ